jgi:hypothetical protein
MVIVIAIQHILHHTQLTICQLLQLQHIQLITMEILRNKALLPHKLLSNSDLLCIFIFIFIIIIYYI